MCQVREGRGSDSEGRRLDGHRSREIIGGVRGYLLETLRHFTALAFCKIKNKPAGSRVSDNWERAPAQRCSVCSTAPGCVRASQPLKLRL